MWVWLRREYTYLYLAWSKVWWELGDRDGSVEVSYVHVRDRISISWMYCCAMVGDVLCFNFVLLIIAILFILFLVCVFFINWNTKRPPRNG